MVSEDESESTILAWTKGKNGRGARDKSSSGARSDSWPGPFRSWHIDSMEWRMVRGRRRSRWRLSVPLRLALTLRSALDV